MSDKKDYGITDGEVEELSTGEFIERFQDYQKSLYDAGVEMFGEMRGFTQEESDAYEDALDKMFKPTGRNLFDFIEKKKDGDNHE